MPITFACPNCDSSLEMSGSQSGQVIRCPKCKGRITVPRRTLPRWALVGIILAATAIIGVMIPAFKKHGEVGRLVEPPVLTAEAVAAQRPEAPTWVMDECTLARSGNQEEGTYTVNVGSRFRATVGQDSYIGQRIYSLLKDGGVHKLALHVHFPPGSENAVITAIRGSP